MAKDAITNLPWQNVLTDMPPDLNSSKEIPKTDDFSEFKEKNIPTPEEFGLTFGIKVPIPVEPEPSPKVEEKMGFFKKIFTKKEKNDVPKIANEVKDAELNNEVPDLPSEIIISEKPKTEPEIPKMEQTEKSPENWPALPTIFKVNEKNDKKQELIKKLKEINDIQKELKIEQKESKDTFAELKKLKEMLFEKETHLNTDRNELNKKLTDARSLEINQKKSLSEFETKVQSLNEFKDLLLEDEKAILSQKEVIKNENNRIKELKKNLLNDEIEKARSTTDKSREMIKTLSHKINEIKTADIAIEKTLNSVFEKETKIFESEIRSKLKEKILEDEGKNLKEKLIDVKSLEVKQRKMLSDFEAKYSDLTKFKDSLEAKEKELFSYRDSLNTIRIKIGELRKNLLKDEIAKAKAVTIKSKEMAMTLQQKIVESKLILESAERKKEIISKKEKKLADRERILKQKNSLLKSYPSKSRVIEKKEKELALKEQLLNSKEDNLKRLGESLKNKETEFLKSKNMFDRSVLLYSKEKEEIEDSEFRDYLNKKLSEIAGRKESLNETKIIDAPPKVSREQLLFNLLAECKNQIKLRNFEEAKKLYNQIRLDYYDANIPTENKESLYNQIRTLYDDINLGMLSR